MRGYVTNIEHDTLENNDFRRVIYTAEHSQLVLMTLQPGEEIGVETHQLDQFLRIEAGTGTAILNGESVLVSDGSALVVPAGTEHNVVNSGTEPLRLYTIYSPPDHKHGTRHVTRVDALADDQDHFDGQTSITD